MGIDAIATDEGVKRFVTLFLKDPGTDRIIVSARLAGLDTFCPAPLPEPENVRYLEKVAIYANPEIESIFQTHICHWKVTLILKIMFLTAPIFFQRFLVLKQWHRQQLMPLEKKNLKEFGLKIFT
jgi:hypothetical protein